jgi:protein N-terminal amidase
MLDMRKVANKYLLGMDLKYASCLETHLSALTIHSPYKFEAPWSAWEFAYHVLHKEANLVILSMAWLTREDARSYSRSPKDPDMETLSYWLGRLEPVIRAETQGEIIFVFANRTGIEDDAVYAGTSAVLGIHDGEVKVYGILGRGEKELLVVDTNKRPQAKLVSEPNSAASQPTRSSETSGLSHNSIDSVMSDTSCQTAGSENTAYTTPDLDPVELIQKIEEAMAPVSPVDANSPSAFYAPQARYPEPEALKGTLKSSIGQPQISPAKSVSPAVGRPVSPKSRNASRNRMHEPSAPSPASSVSPTVGRTPSRNASRNRMHEQSEPSPAKSVSPRAGRYPSQNGSQNRMHEPSEPNLALPDLAKRQQRQQQRGRRRNLNNVFSPTLPQPHSASAAPDKYQASFTMGPRSAYIASRPKSAMW